MNIDMSNAKLIIEYSVKVFLDEETKQYIGHCPELNYTGIGSTPQEALASTQESVKLALDWCLEHKTLETVLQESGYKAIDIDHQPVWKPREELLSFKGNLQLT